MNTRTFITTGDGARIHYRFDGEGDKPILLLSNSIATTLQMWDAQVQELTRHFQVLRYDTRGHGASSVPAGPYSLDRFGRDVIELLDALNIERVHFLGLSLGGIIGQWLGVHAPDRIDRLILSNTSPYLGPSEQWDQLVTCAQQASDMSEFANMFLNNWFPAHMLEAQPPVIEDFRRMVLSTDPQGLAGAYAAIRDLDLRRTIALVERPTLVIAGQYDNVTALAHGEQIAATIPGSTLQVLPSVHLPNIEFPIEFMHTVLTFLQASDEHDSDMKTERSETAMSRGF
ncbi:alpha/beta fold hydrolase [Halomonas binhaiensis]|uniref:Alpha/beta fold hydrolase n=1 Tax=Halomonas binhaiensis TaxID=2562282 RepID=A0A5C1NGP4_9GAMM|nr:alpha/beta fold hydrolase [Halomonas binhaiensis]QEM82426.1 alpha/beta fold hydrolase [Halomonas binhaiensis]